MNTSFCSTRPLHNMIINSLESTKYYFFGTDHISTVLRQYIRLYSKTNINKREMWILHYLYTFLLNFQHKWIFLSTMQQPLPNQISLGPAEMISLVSFSDEWSFYSCSYVHVRTPQKNYVPKDFGLLGIWFTEFTLC